MGYSTLKAALDAVVKTNGRQGITGSNLNGVMTTLLKGVDVLDRANPADTSGMNKVVLDKTGTFSGQVTDQNTIYEIRDSFDLGGGSVTIPVNCVLKFNGGNIKNGEIVGQNTTIIGESNMFYRNVVLSGTYLNSYGKIEWIVDGSIADKLEKVNSFFPTLIGVGIYVINRQVKIVNNLMGVGRLASAGENGIDYRGMSVLVYTGDTSDVAVPPGNARDSILLLDTISGITIENIGFVCSSNYSGGTEIQVDSLSITNDNFAGIKYTNTSIGVGRMSVVNCSFIGLPRGISIYDLSQTTSAPYINNVDSWMISNCNFRNCRVGIYNDNSTYNIVVIKPTMTGGTNAKRHIELQSGCLYCIDGYFGPLSYVTGDVKSVFYFGTRVKWYTIVNPYGENHGGWCIYDLGTAPNESVVMGGSFLVDQNNSPTYPLHYTVNGVDTVDNVNASVFNGRGSSGRSLNIYSTRFTGWIITESAKTFLYGVDQKAVTINAGTNATTIGIDSALNGSAFSAISAAGTYQDYKDNKRTIKLSSVPFEGSIQALNILTQNDLITLSISAYMPEALKFDYRARTTSVFGKIRPGAETDGSQAKGQDTNNTLRVGSLGRTSDGKIVVVNSLGINRTLKFGSEGATRPTFTTDANIMKGYEFFDTTLNKPIWWTGSGWVDATGAAVQ